MMGKRRLFLLFLTSMAFTVIILLIIYGLIKDSDLVSFNVKNPDTAPMPLATPAATQPVVEEPGPESHVSTPEEDKAKAEEAAKANAADSADDEEPLTNVVQMEPKLGRSADETDMAQPTDESNNSQGSGSPDEVVPQPLSYVLMDGFTSRQSADMTRQELINRGVSPAPTVRQVNGRLVLQFGIYSDRTNANAMAEQLRARNVYVKVE